MRNVDVSNDLSFEDNYDVDADTGKLYSSGVVILTHLPVASHSFGPKGGGAFN